MPATLAEVILWDRVVGALAWDPARRVGSFEYAVDFLPSGVEIAPLTMPLRAGAFVFPDLPERSFKGLPGLIADALPDRFGNLLIDQWLAREGRAPGDFNPVERLCYLGARGMGALEFRPALRGGRDVAAPVRIDALVRLANEALARKAGLATAPAEDDAAHAAALRDILRVGTSAGGARAKAVVAWHPATGEFRSGQVDAPEGFEHWLLKFDGVSENRDKETLADPQGYGRIEYAYHRMARAAGVVMSDCRLFEENGRAHFMTRRFDRPGPGAGAPRKLHLQSLCALAHYDFNAAGAYAYEQAFAVARALGLPPAALEELFRRAVFNVVARNQDDHTKNIAFLMDQAGRWSLAPAYDIAYAYNPDGQWTARHQMTLAGKTEVFTPGDLLACARAAGLKTGRAKAVVAEVAEAVRHWPEFAAEAGVAPETARRIAAAHRLGLAPAAAA
jgi:serine/threonine-protein kinase HipA